MCYVAFVPFTRWQSICDTLLYIIPDLRHEICKPNVSLATALISDLCSIMTFTYSCPNLPNNFRSVKPQSTFNSVLHFFSINWLSCFVFYMCVLWPLNMLHVVLNDISKINFHASVLICVFCHPAMHSDVTVYCLNSGNVSVVFC